MNKKEALTTEIEKIISEREIEKKSRILAEKELNITKKELQMTQQDLQNLQQRMNPNINTANPMGPNSDLNLINQQEKIIEMTPIINQQQKQMQHQIQKKYMDSNIDKKQAAYQIYKDSKATIIICFIAMLMPFISILIAMMQPMYAMIIALIGMIYPCYILVRMVSIQSKLNQIYGFKPILQFKQSRQNFYQQTQQPRRIYDNQEKMI